MRALLIGGTGTISGAITRRLAQDENWEIYLFNRGRHAFDIPVNVKVIHGDISNEEEAAKLLEGMQFDCVSEFNAFTPDQVERDIRLFSGKTKQYIFVSSAAAYQTPPPSPYMTEGMLLRNPHWQYARNKISCEEVLLKAFREDDFPITIVRPSHTYNERHIPFCLESPLGSWPVIQRMIDGKPIIVPGDGTSLWTITFNEDVAKGFTGLMGNLHAIGEAVHITTDESLTWNQMAQVVADEISAKYTPYYIPTSVISTLKPVWGEGLEGDKRHCVIYDNSKVKRLVPGYCATVSWREGVHRCMKNILTHAELRQQDADFDKWCDGLIGIYDKALDEAKRTL